MRLRPGARGGRPAAPERTVPLQARAVVGNLVAAGDGVWAWYRLPDVPYWFTDVAHRRQQRSAAMARFADMVGHRLQFRVTEHPVAAAAWAADFRSRTAHRARTPESARAESWDDVVDLMRQRIEDLPALTVPAGYVGVRLARERATHGQLAALLRGETVRGLKDTLDALVKLDHVVSGEGWAARPVTGRRLAWLIASSLTPGLPVSSESLAGAEEGWDEATLEEFTAPVRATAEPWAPAVRVEALRQGRVQTVWAAVASLSRTPSRFDDDPRAPLFAWGLGLPWKVQWCADVDVVDGHDLAKRATRVRDELDDQIDHMHELRRKAPLRLTRLRDEAARVEDDRTDPLLDVRVRLVGTVRALVTGSTKDEAVARLDELIRRAVRDQGAVLTTHPGQWAAVRSFVPGEHDPTTATGFVREVPSALAATWGPNTGTRVLDEVGPYRGWTTRRATTPVFWSPAGRPGARSLGAERHLRHPGRRQDATRRPRPGSSRCGWGTSPTCWTRRACCAGCSSCPPCGGPCARSTCSTPPPGSSRRGASCPSRAATTTRRRRPPCPCPPARGASPPGTRRTRPPRPPSGTGAASASTSPPAPPRTRSAAASPSSSC